MKKKAILLISIGLIAAFALWYFVLRDPMSSAPATSADDESNFQWLKEKLAPVGVSNMAWIMEAAKAIYTTGKTREGGTPPAEYMINGRYSKYGALMAVSPGIFPWAVDNGNITPAQYTEIMDKWYAHKAAQLTF